VNRIAEKGDKTVELICPSGKSRRSPIEYALEAAIARNKILSNSLL
jgi:hypothetical protein